MTPPHPLFSTEELLLLLGQQLAPRLQLWRAHTHALSALAQTSRCAALALRPLLQQLKAKEQARLDQLARCAALLQGMPIPLSCWRWVTDHAPALPSTHNSARVSITHNGRIVLLENSSVAGYISTVRVVRTAIQPSSDSAGTITTCTFTRVRTLGGGRMGDPAYHYMGKRLQTRSFHSAEELTYQLHVLTRIGAELWPSCFGVELSEILLRGSDFLPLVRGEGHVYPPSVRPVGAKCPGLFFLDR